MLIWIKDNDGTGTQAGWSVNSVNEAIEFIKKQFPFNYLQLVSYVTDDNRNIIVSKHKFKRMLKEC